MTIVQLMLLTIGLGWIIIGGLALYRRDVNYPGHIVFHIGPIVFFKPHRLQYKGGCAIMFGWILIVCGVIAVLLSLVIR